MPLSMNDVSEYAVPRESQARLVVEIGPSGRTGNRHPVQAWLDDGAVSTGQFTPNPDWGHLPDAPVKSLSTVYAGDLASSTLGTQLFTALFSGGLSRCWARAVEQSRRHAGLHVVIRSADMTVHALPWELLTDPIASSGPVALADGWSVIREYPRPADDPVPVVEPVATADLHVLVMTADAGGVPQGNDPKILGDSFLGADIETVPHIRHESLARALSERNRHVVHLLASGMRVRQGRPILMLGQADDRQTLRVRDFVDALAEHQNDLRLVVLAACDSDIFAADLARTVPNVIGMRGSISDDGCLAFLRGLYRALGSGSTIDQAVASGRAQQIGFSQSLGEEWSLPVLFLGDATPVVQRTTAAPPEKAPEPVEAPSGTVEEQVEKFLLDMKRSNLRSIRAQWGQVEEGTTPPFIQEQIKALDDDVERITNKVRGPTR